MDQQPYAAQAPVGRDQYLNQYAAQQRAQLAAAAPWTAAGPYQHQPSGGVQMLPAYQEAPYQQQPPQQQWQEIDVYQPWPQSAPTHPQQQLQQQNTNNYAAPPAVQKLQAAGDLPVTWGKQQPLQLQVRPSDHQQQQQVAYQQGMQHWQQPAAGPQQQFQQQHQQQYAPPPPQQQWAGGADSAGLGVQLAQLGSDQQKAINAVQQGHCVFLTGGAGVGKSYTVEALVQLLQDKGRTVAVTASTGTAALNVNGMTIHSWAGILDVHKHPVELAEKLWGWEKWMAQWEHADVLVLDEISMVDCDLLEKVDYLARYMRGWRITQHSLYGGLFVHELHPLPFGGLQVVAVGDFFQLSPVHKDSRWRAEPVKKQQPIEKGNTAKKQPPPGTVDQKVPVIMALLPPEAVDAHVEARAAKLAKKTTAAQDLEYQMHYGVRPVRQQQQQIQPLAQHQHQHQQQKCGVQAPGAATAAGGGSNCNAGTAGSTRSWPYGCMQPLTAWQLMQAPAAPAAAPAAVQGQQPGAVAGVQAAGQAVGGVAAAAHGQPAIKQEAGPQQQQVQQERLEFAGALQSAAPCGQQQWPADEEQELLSPLLPAQVFPELPGLQQQQQPDEGLYQPAFKRRRTADAEGLYLAQQQQQQASPRAQDPGSSTDAGRNAAAAEQQPAAVTADGAGSSYRLADSPDEDDMSYEATSTAIQQAESQSRSQHQAASPLQQHASRWLSPQQQQQQHGAPAKAATSSQASPQFGTPYHSARSVPRSALSDLQLQSQAPLPFGESFAAIQQPAAAADAAADAAASQVRAHGSANGLLPCTQLEAASAAAVVAAAAVPLPGDSPVSGVGHAAAGQDPNSQGTQADAPVTAAAAAAAGQTAAGTADTAAAPGSPDVVVLDSQETAAAGAAEPAALDLSLSSPAGYHGVADAAGTGSEVIEILESDSAPATPRFAGPIDLTMSPAENVTAAAALRAAGEKAAAAETGKAGSGQQEQAQQMDRRPGWRCEALFALDQTKAAAPAAAGPDEKQRRRALCHQQQQQQQQVWQPPQQHAWQQQQQGWLCQQYQQPLLLGPGTVTPSTGLGHLSNGQGNPAASSANSAAAAAASAAFAASAAANSNDRRSSKYTHLLQMLERAANMPLTPPASPRRAPAEAAAATLAAAAAGGGEHIDPEQYHDRNLRGARDVCGCLFSRGLARSRLFEVKEVELGHMYGRCNGRTKTAWQAGSLKPPELHESRPEGYNWSRTSSNFSAADAAGYPAPESNQAGSVETAGSVGTCSGCTRRPLQLSKSPARATTAAAAAAAVGVTGSSSGGAGGVSRWDVPRLPVQYLKPVPTSGEYCFKSPAWAATNFRPVILREAFRQSDPDLLDALNELRLGRMTERTRCLLSECKRPLPNDGIGATHLFPRNEDADKVNKMEYEALAGPEMLYGAMDGCEPAVYGQADIESRLDRNTNASRVVKLKAGTQVLLLYNVDVLGGLANGTRGVVEGFVGVRDYLKQENVKVVGGPSSDRLEQGSTALATEQQSCQSDTSCSQGPQQRPLPPHQHPGYADPSAAFPPANLCPVSGQCSVLGCPCQQKPWSQLTVQQQTQYITVQAKLPDQELPVMLELPAEKWRRDKIQKAIIWFNHTNTRALPKCRFTVSSRCGGIPWEGAGSSSSGWATYKWLVVGPQQWKHKANTMRHFGVQLERVQVPLLHAWAISIHKSQGMSISKLVVNVQRSFAAGMVYVALSRCTSRDGLQIVGDVPAPQSSDDVRSFYRYLFSIEPRDS